MFPPTDIPVQPPDDIPVEETSAQATEQESVFTDEDIKKALEDILKSVRDEDRFVRDDFVRLWKRLDYYWNNILDIFLDPVNRDWRVPNWDELEESGEYSPRLINIYRPHGEAIVAALSVTIPSVLFPPDDAENPNDLETSKNYRNISQLLQNHNEGAMLFIRAIVIMFNQGTIFGYNYKHSDPKFGTISTPKIELKDVKTFESRCPDCGYPIDAGLASEMPSQMSPQGPAIGAVPEPCPQCGSMNPPSIEEGLEKLPQIVGFDESPKGMVCQKLFDGRQVKVPQYVKEQEECGYLLLEFVQSTAMLRSIWPDKAEQIRSRQYDQYESFSKIPPQYLGYLPDNASNVACLWLRPWQFWLLGDSVTNIDLIKFLTSKFPDGCYAIFIDDILMDIYPEKMDEHWTISRDPLGAFIYMRPLGENLATVQDIRAELVEIEIQTAEYGIPETFVDGKVLEMEKYGEGRSKPGMITQVKPRPGKSISDGFFQTKAATLSQEIDPLRQHIDQDAQFVVGSFPSVYGGPAIGGSKTASEYSQSREVALQRLGTFWKILCDFWAKFMSRSVTEYAQLVKDSGRDEKFAVKTETGSYINTWIRHAAMEGKIGKVSAESSEQLPVSWAQKKDAIMALFQAPIPEVMSVLVHPNNAGLMKRAIGLEELYIPGEEGRIRQMKEFLIMSQGIPAPVNPLVDNHQVHIEVLKTILEGPQGEDIDSQVLDLCMMHLQEHMQADMMMNPEPEETGPEGQSGEQSSETQETSNVPS